MNAINLPGTILRADECSWTMRYVTFNWHTCNRPWVAVWLRDTVGKFWCDCGFWWGNGITIQGPDFRKILWWTYEKLM